MKRGLEKGIRNGAERKRSEGRERESQAFEFCQLERSAPVELLQYIIIHTQTLGLVWFSTLAK